jgi:hypothetical protein
VSKGVGRLHFLPVLLLIPSLLSAQPAPKPAKGAKPAAKAPAKPAIPAFTLPRPEFPQIRITRVDATNPGDWRVYLSLLDEGGTSLSLNEHDVSLFLARSPERARIEAGNPATRFEKGQPKPGFDGRMLKLEKAPSKQAVVFVIGLHSDVDAEVREAIGKAVGTVLGGLRKDALVGVVFYGDRIRVLWSPDGSHTELRNVNDYPECLLDLRKQAGTIPDPAAAAVKCARLFPKPDIVKEAMKTVPAGQGLFPRLFGIEEPSDVITAARKKGHDRLDLQDLKAENKEFFAAGAIEAAARMLVANSPADALREIVVLSDGRDGYLRVADLISDRLAPTCDTKSKACRDRKSAAGTGGTQAGTDSEGASIECTREVLTCTIPKVAVAMQNRETVVREHLTELIQTLRAHQVRVWAIATPDADTVGRARLLALSAKTGGTFRQAADKPQMSKELAKSLSEELANEVALVPGASLDPSASYEILVTCDDLSLVSGPYGFATGTKVPLYAGPWNKLRAFAIEKLGHSWGPTILWIVVIVVAVVLLYLVYKLFKLILGLVKKAGEKAVKAAKGKVPKPPAVKAPAAPKAPDVKAPKIEIPKLKRPQLK